MHAWGEGKVEGLPPITDEVFRDTWDTVERKKLYTNTRFLEKMEARQKGVTKDAKKWDDDASNFGHPMVFTQYRDFLRLTYKSEETNKIREEYNDSKQANRTLNANHCLNFSKIVRDHFRPFEHLIKNLDSNPFKADYLAPNPYFVDVSAITVNHETLKNFLHIRVFMNRSVSDEKKKLHTPNERFDHAKGRIKAIFIIVKDQVIRFILIMNYDYDPLLSYNFATFVVF